jgi:hypothetical protein
MSGCTTGSHSFSSQATESCTWGRGKWRWGCYTSGELRTCTATRTEIGCY